MFSKILIRIGRRNILEDFIINRKFIPLILLSVLAICFLIVPRAEGQLENEWSRTYGGQNDDLAHSVVQTDDGGYALAGFTRSYGAGGSDFWLVKTDSEGDEEWSKTYGGQKDELAYSVVQTDDGGYALAGYTGSYGEGIYDFWLVKTDSEGDEEWSKTYGGEYWDKAYSVVQTDDGGFAIAGETGSYGSEKSDFWLVKTDSQGDEEWSKTYGGQNRDLAHSVVQTDDGGYALAGLTGSYSTGLEDFWLVKTDSQGDEEWSENYGGQNRERAYSVAQTDDGGYGLVGYTESYGEGIYDFWLVKTDSQGDEEWSRTYGGQNDDLAHSVVQTDDGGYGLVGGTTSFGAGGGDAWFVKSWPPFMYGDSNSDGKVDIVDAQLIAKYLVDSVSENELDRRASDVNRDGKVGIGDALLVAKLDAGLIESLPVEASDNGVEGQEATVSVDSATISPDGTKTVDVEVKDVPDPGLGAYSLTVSYNPGLIEVIGIEGGESPFNSVTSNVENEKVMLSGFHASDSEVSKAVVAKIKFRAVGEKGETTDLNLKVREVYDAEARKISATSSDGTIEIGSPEIIFWGIGVAVLIIAAILAAYYFRRGETGVEEAEAEAETIYCPECGEEVSDENKYCPECGEELD